MELNLIDSKQLTAHRKDCGWRNLCGTNRKKKDKSRMWNSVEKKATSQIKGI